MKPALVVLSVLASLSLWFVVQDTRPVECRGKSLPITLLPGPKMSGPTLPLRFGGTRELPRPPVNSFVSYEGFRQVFKNRDEFGNFLRRSTGRFPADNFIPPALEIDFSKEMVVVAAMGERPTSGYWIYIDGACEVDGRVEVFVSSVEGSACSGVGQFTVLTYPADGVRLPRTDLPVVFRETRVSCEQWHEQLRRSKSN